MAREEAPKTPPLPHAFLLDGRQKAEITGVRQVVTFDENSVALKTDFGELLLSGERLHVTRLMLEEGKLALEGRVDALEYRERARGRGLFKRP